MKLSFVRFNEGVSNHQAPSKDFPSTARKAKRPTSRMKTCNAPRNRRTYPLRLTTRSRHQSALITRKQPARIHPSYLPLLFIRQGPRTLHKKSKAHYRTSICTTRYCNIIKHKSHCHNFSKPTLQSPRINSQFHIK